jgi:hypothetical protein
MKQEFIIGDIVMYKNRIHTIIDIYLLQMVMNYLM